MSINKTTMTIYHCQESIKNEWKKVEIGRGFEELKHSRNPGRICFYCEIHSSPLSTHLQQQAVARDAAAAAAWSNTKSCLDNNGADLGSFVSFSCKPVAALLHLATAGPHPRASWRASVVSFFCEGSDSFKRRRRKFSQETLFFFSEQSRNSFAKQSRC